MAGGGGMVVNRPEGDDKVGGEGLQGYHNMS